MVALPSLMIAFLVGFNAASYVNGAPVSNLMDIKLDDFKILLDQLENVTGWVTYSLSTYCNMVSVHDLPFGLTCMDYAQYTGTKHVICSRPISSPTIHDGADRSFEASILEVLDGISDHSAMLNAILSLPKYFSLSECINLTSQDPDYFICRLKTHQSYNMRILRSLDYLLDSLETDLTKLPDFITCMADSSIQKKVPAGVLWKIQKDVEIHKTNMKTACEQVKLAQEVTDFSCA